MNQFPIIQTFIGKQVRFFRMKIKVEIRGHNAPQSSLELRGYNNPQASRKIDLETWGIPLNKRG